jgi:hypothetical protein
LIAADAFWLGFGASSVRQRASPRFRGSEERPQRDSKTPPTYGHSVAERRENDAEDTTQDDASRRSVSALSPDADPVEAVLAGAIARAAKAGRFDVVAQLAQELEARRPTERFPDGSHSNSGGSAAWVFGPASRFCRDSCRNFDVSSLVCTLHIKR